MVNIRNILMNGGAITPCGKEPDGSKTHYECLRSGIYIGKQEGLKQGKKQGRERQTKFGKKQLALSSSLAEDKRKTSFGVGRDIGKYQAEQKAEGQLKKQKEFEKKKEILAAELGKVKGRKVGYKTGRKVGLETGKQEGIKEFEDIAKEAKKERIDFYKTGKKVGFDKGKQEEKVIGEEQLKKQKEFGKRKESLAAELGKVSGKREEKQSGRKRLEDATVNQLKGYAADLGVIGYQKMLKDDVIKLLKNMGKTYIKVEGGKLKGKGCGCNDCS